MRVLLVGKVLTKEEREKWHEDRQRRAIHRPSYHGWHYANAVYAQIADNSKNPPRGMRVKIGYYCRVCKVGAIFEDWRTET